MTQPTNTKLPPGSGFSGPPSFKTVDPVGKDRPRPPIVHPTIPKGTPTSPTSPTDNSYTDIIKQTLASWDLSDLYGLVDQLGRTGASSDEISLRIQQSDAYHKRFAGNDARLKNGLGVLSPAEYIAMEGAYRQIVSSLPPGFYDTRDAWATWIGGDVSATELSQRVQIANQAYVNAAPEARSAWDQYYGTSGTSGAIAAILDTNVAEPLLEERAQAAGIGGAALASGLALTSQATATKAAQQGVTIDSARQAFQGIASRLSTDQSLSGRYANAGTGVFGQSQEENATLLGDAGAQKQQQLLYSQEAAQFAGRGGANDAGGSAGANY